MLHHLTKSIKISFIDDDGTRYEGEVQLRKTGKGKTRIVSSKTRDAPKSKHAKEPRSIMDYLLLLKSQGFFKSPRSRQDILKKLATMNQHYEGNSLDSPLRRAFKSKKLGRISKKGIYMYVAR